MKRGPFIHSSSTTRMLMLQVVLALVPAMVAVAWRHGAHGCALLAVCALAACLADFVCARKQAFDGSALLIGLVLALMLPATAPLWLGGVASVAAVVFGKHFFGGLGKNPLNPAAAARAAFMALLPSYFLAPAWPVDGTSSATPLATESTSVSPPVSDIMLGNYPGSLGEAMPLAILTGGLLLLALRTIDWRPPIVFLSVLALLALVLPPGARMEGHAPWLAGNPVVHLLSGGTLLAAFFMITDPVTSPITVTGRIVAATIAATYCILVRYYTPYPDGAVFSVLVANAATPMIDRWCIPTRPGSGS